MITTKQLQMIRELNAQGWSDAQIAKEIGYSASTVNNWRAKLGLPANFPHNHSLATKQLEQLKELNQAGLSDIEISKRLGCGRVVARNWRVKLGLPAKGKPGRKPGSKKKRYTVYDKYTSEYICEGTAQEISEYIGIAVSTIYPEVTMARKGKPRTRYEIVEVEDDE